ncbi:MAG: hypothetical protein ACI8Z1_002395 [Candidatus Azotimanducaceae bacterium]|jgi:hypothetical protein
MSDDLEQIGLDAIDKFLSTWNSRSAEDWAGSLNYPHVRPSPAGPINVAETRGMYIKGVDFNQVVATGWDHSEWDYRHVLHVSLSRIHVAGQWSRYNSDSQVILSTPIVYIVTLVDGQWGIQCRMASDYADEETDTTELQSRGLKLVQDFVNHQNNANHEASTELLNFPHYSIGNGELKRSATASDFALIDTPLRIESLMAVQTGNHAINIAADLSLPDGSLRQAAVHINDREGHLGIQAWSILNPNEGSPS